MYYTSITRTIFIIINWYKLKILHMYNIPFPQNIDISISGIHQ